MAKRIPQKGILIMVNLNRRKMVQEGMISLGEI